MRKNFYERRDHEAVSWKRKFNAVSVKIPLSAPYAIIGYARVSFLVLEPTNVNRNLTTLTGLARSHSHIASILSSMS